MILRSKDEIMKNAWIKLVVFFILNLIISSLLKNIEISEESSFIELLIILGLCLVGLVTLGASIAICVLLFKKNIDDIKKM